jgi:poly(3-hydroxyalkanoate) depolymerase
VNAVATVDAANAERTSAMVDLGDVTIHVSIQGSGDPLLVVGGIGANVVMMAPLLDAMDGARTVAFDLPGAGSSTNLRRPYSMAGLAALVVRLLDALELERVDLLGVSFGGGLAQQIAHDAPERVRRLILAATSCGIGSVPGRPWSAAVLSTPLRYYSPAYFKLVAPIFMGGDKWRDPKFVREHAEARRSRPPSLLGYYQQMLAASSWTSLPWVHTLRHQTLVLSGSKDPIVPPINGTFLAWRIPDARHQVIRGGGHLFLLDEAETACAMIQEFLN